MKKRVICIVLSLVMMFGALTIAPSSVSANSEKSKAMIAYRNFVAKHRDIRRFSTIYLDNNNMPELVVIGYGDTAYTYTYKKGKVKSTNMNFGSYFMTGKLRYYKKTGLIESVNVKSGIITYAYPMLKGTKFIPKFYNTGGLDGSSEKPKYYKIDNKGKTIQLTKSAYNSFKKKLTKGKKISVAKFYKNTKKNRNKYLK